MLLILFRVPHETPWYLERELTELLLQGLGTGFPLCMGIKLTPSQQFSSKLWSWLPLWFKSAMTLFIIISLALLLAFFYTFNNTDIVSVFQFSWQCYKQKTPEANLSLDKHIWDHCEADMPCINGEGGKGRKRTFFPNAWKQDWLICMLYLLI